MPRPERSGADPVHSGTGPVHSGKGGLGRGSGCLSLVSLHGKEWVLVFESGRRAAGRGGQRAGRCWRARRE